MGKKRITEEEFTSDSVVLKESGKGQRSYEVKTYFQTWEEGHEKLKTILADVQKWKFGELFEDEVIPREKSTAEPWGAAKDVDDTEGIAGRDQNESNL